jgi:hypothetical protein
MTGLWGWGEADAGEWQTLYRIEGARRALAQRRDRDATTYYLKHKRELKYREWRRREDARLAWEKTPEGQAELARRAAARLAEDLRQDGIRFRAKARSPTYAPGGRRHRIWQAVRSGRTSRDVAAEFGLSRSRVSQIASVQDRVEAARLEVERNRVWARVAARRELGRPVDMGGPRDVWLTYLPPPDPRLDNMVPVE